MAASTTRGSTTGRPIMVLLDVLGRRWTLRVLWELREAPLTFRELQARCDQVSPTSLNKRLKELRELQLVRHDERGYALTRWGESLGTQLLDLDRWAGRWARRVPHSAR
ncbi:MAG: helix-turn-helix domain-containing protein [Pseudomonadota bacterium]